MDNKSHSFVFDYKLHSTILFISSVSLYVGVININLFYGFKLLILPLVISLLLAIVCYLFKPFKWISKNQSGICSLLMLVLIGPLVAKLAISSGQNIEMLLNVGPLLVFEELGDIGTIVFGLPIALLLGFKRECIGMTSSICREPQMVVLIDKYGFDSSEVKGFFTVYLIGLVLGTLFISLIVNLLVYFIPLHPFSYALASGIGSTSMSVAAISSLSVIYPGMANKLLALGGISNLISIVFSIYVYIFISLPLTEWLYNKIGHYFNWSKNDYS